MIHSALTIRYDSDVHPDFQQALKARVAAWVDAQPNGRFATPLMWFKVVFFVSAYWLVWAQLALVDHNVPTTLALIAVFACLCISTAYTVSHDAVHHAVSRVRWVNDALFYFTFNPLGPNGYLWRERHTIVHHSCVNVPGWDFNIEVAKLLRFAPTQEWRPIHRFQHLYAPLLYVFFTLDWVFVKDVRMLGMDTIGNVTDIRHPWWRYVEVFGWKAIYVAYMIVLPAVTLNRPLWQVLAGFLIFQMFVSFQFVLTFTGSHLNEGMVFTEADADRQMPYSFLEHALRTSLDFHPRDPVVSFFFGGFNAHVAHHMFPHICSVHYPALTGIIEQTAAEYDLPYRQMSLAQLYVAHFRYLKAMGSEREAPFDTYMYHPKAG